MKHRIALAVCLLLTTILSAQEVSLSTNLLDWANLGTANLQAGISFSRHLSLHAGARYNKWDFGSAGFSSISRILSFPSTTATPESSVVHAIGADTPDTFN